MLTGKRALIVGVATERSIAWGIAQAMHAQGAELAFSYANDTFKERLAPLAASIGSELTMPLDVQFDDQIDAAFAVLKREWGQIDILVHAVAFAPREALAGSSGRVAFLGGGTARESEGLTLRDIASRLGSSGGPHATGGARNAFR